MYVHIEIYIFMPYFFLNYHSKLSYIKRGLEFNQRILLPN